MALTILYIWFRACLLCSALVVLFGFGQFVCDAARAFLSTRIVRSDRRRSDRLVDSPWMLERRRQ